MLELVDIDAGYGRTRVIHGVSIPGSTKIVAVLGHNGAGKTTLLRATIGLIRPTRGTVLFDGEDVTHLEPNRRVQRGMAYVAQGQQSFGQLTTMENLQLVADGRRNGKAKIAEMLERFPALGQFATRSVMPMTKPRMRATAATGFAFRRVRNTRGCPSGEPLADHRGRDRGHDHRARRGRTQRAAGRAAHRLCPGGRGEVRRARIRTGGAGGGWRHGSDGRRA